MLDTECGTEEKYENGAPSDAQFGNVGKLAPGSTEDHVPCTADCGRKGFFGNVFTLVEKDDEDEEPGNNGGDDPVVTGLFTDYRGNPDTEL